MVDIQTIGLIFILGILALMLGSLIGTRAYNDGGINGLVKKVRNKSNADYVDRLIMYHNSRIMHGADEKESLTRLERELKELCDAE